MRWRVFRRRLATAGGIYGAALLGFLGTVVAFRVLGVADFGRLALVLAAAGFVQMLVDLTVEEAVVKYGFRYVAREDWGRLRRLFAVTLRFKALGAAVGALVVAALALASGPVFGDSRLLVPMLVAAAIPLVQIPEGLAASALILRSRYDLRAGFLAFSMGLRLAALGVGSLFGVLEAVIGVVVAQAVASLAIGAVGAAAFRRYPAAEAAPLAEDVPGIRSFVLQSSVGTGLVSLRTAFAPVLLGVVATAAQVGYFRAAQAPQAGFASLSAPVRLILLTEQTRDFERGRGRRLLSGLRRYTVGSTLLMAIALPPLVWLMPELLALVYGDEARPAADAARFILGAAAIQLVLGWTKSFPVSIGRPGLRIVAHGVEVLTLVPALAVLGALYGATGAGAAVLVSTCAFALAWLVLFSRLRGSLAGGGEPGAELAEPRVA